MCWRVAENAGDTPGLEAVFKPFISRFLSVRSSLLGIHNQSSHDADSVACGAGKLARGTQVDKAEVVGYNETALSALRPA